MTLGRGIAVAAFLLFAGAGLYLGWSLWFVVPAFIAAILAAF